MNRHRAGFTLLELLVVVVMAGVIAAISAGPIGDMIVRQRVTRASQAIQNDLRSAFSLAARNREPIRISWDATDMQFKITNRDASVTFRTTGLGVDAGYGLRSSQVSVYPSTYLEVFPNGLASDTLSVTLTTSASTKRVWMSRAGLVQLRNP